MKKKPESEGDLELHGGGPPSDVGIHKADSHKRANDLDGRDWTKYSISIWSDISWTKEEKALKHPAKFPVHLAERLIRCFTKSSERRILDPFLGSGTTLVGAKNLNRQGVGFELYEDFVNLAKERLRQGGLFGGGDTEAEIHQMDARRIPEVLAVDSVDFCLTSPPYWNILTEKRSADGKAIRNYGDAQDDLGTIGDYEGFLTELMHVFAGVRRVLKDGKYMVVNVMDLRKKDTFFPYHIDLSRRIVEAGFTLDDIIIWDRRKDYNNLRALGYPYTFRVNKAHEFLLIFQKRV
jgi:DNA modification methylase